MISARTRFFPPAAKVASCAVHGQYLDPLSVVERVVLVGNRRGAGLYGFSGNAHLGSGLLALVFALPLMLLRETLRRFAFGHCISWRRLRSTRRARPCNSPDYSRWRTWRWSLFGIFAVMAAGCAVASLGWIVSHWQSRPLAAHRALADWQHTWAIVLVAGQLHVDEHDSVHHAVDHRLCRGAAAAGLFGSRRRWSA